MGFIMTILYVLIFALCAGVIISVLVYVPAFLYVIPYSWWIGGQYTIGKHHDRKKDTFWQSVRHATELYKAWLSRREPTF